MSKKYSKSTGGFYDSAIHGDNIPDDAVGINDDYHQLLLSGQAQGKIITADDQGVPILSDYVPTFDELKTAKITEIGQAFIAELGAGFTTTGGIKMDAGIEDVQLLKSAYDLMILLNQSTLPILVDYDNVAHVNVPLTEVIAIIIEVAVNYQTLYAKKQTLRGQAMAATSATELNAINWT
jgi:hypothetical protein